MVGSIQDDLIECRASRPNLTCKVLLAYLDSISISAQIRINSDLEVKSLGSSKQTDVAPDCSYIAAIAAAS